MNEEKIKELFSNEEFVNDLFESESYEVAQKKLACKGVEVSIDELKQTVDLLKKRASGELKDEDLEEVSGGCTLIGGILAVCSLIAIGGVTYGANRLTRAARDC